MKKMEMEDGEIEENWLKKKKYIENKVEDRGLEIVRVEEKVNFKMEMY